VERKKARGTDPKGKGTKPQGDPVRERNATQTKKTQGEGSKPLERPSTQSRGKNEKRAKKAMRLISRKNAWGKKKQKHPEI